MTPEQKANKSAYGKTWRMTNPEKVASYIKPKEYYNTRAKVAYAKNKNPVLSVYRTAKARCQNPKHVSYAYYGGRGITFEFESFEQFSLELGPRPEGLSLDRIDNGQGYKPGNIRWADLADQAANRRPREPGETGHTNVYATKYGYYKVIIQGTYHGCRKTLEEALTLKDAVWLSLKAQ